MTVQQPTTRPVDTCPVCENSGPMLFEGPDRLHDVPGRYSYRRCSECGTVYQDPRVIEEHIGRLYEGAYYTHEHAPDPLPPLVRSRASPALRVSVAVRAAVAPSATSSSPPRLGRLLARSRWLRERAFSDQVLDEFLPFATPAGRAIDLGCGSGRLLARLPRVGWEAEGLEPDPVAADRARAHSERPVTVGRIPDDVPEGPFDLISLVHVFEHLSDPVSTLELLRDRLSAKGRIVLIYPNPRSLLSRVWRDDWFGWEIPRHLSLLPIGALRRAAATAGLRCRSVRTIARWSTSLSAQSRALRDGFERLEGGIPVRAPTGVDRLLGHIERGMVTAGLPVGEEIVAVLEATDV